MNKKIIITKILPKLTSDHKPVQFILEDEEDLGPIPFRFSPLWTERDSFIDIVKTTWAKPVTGSSSYVWEQKLKATKQALKEWIKKHAPNPASQRKEIVQSLEVIKPTRRKLLNLLSNIPLLVSPEDNFALINPITEEEIIKVIWSMDSDKAPGPDGFTIHFYKTYWDIVKADLLKMAKGFMKKVKEIIHSSKQRKEKGMLIKLDMANAFDRVNCSFLYKVLHSFGFSHHFVNLIVACTHNPWISPLVNGHPTSLFQAQRGLRQGCPLSPFLYILMAGSLSRKLTAEKVSGSLPGLKPSNTSPAQNHSLFVDDSLLLGGASIRISKSFDSILKSYCRVSRASINDRKSEVYGWNIGQQEITSISSIIGFNGHAH
eukprot:PITA_24857